ncbi:hypothetical protein P3558_14510 [Vibrio parahaemolyticus]|nr:hypothetical protein [Vibrio parahaemolyticus]
MLTFLAFTMDQGIGGHYYSLKALSEQYVDSKVVIIGHTKPRVKYHNLTFISIRDNGYCGAFSLLYKIINVNDTLHCFDEHSFSFARVVSIFKNNPLVLTKCGGKPLRYYPRCYSISVFSKEDQEHFHNKNVSSYLIPNRINRNEIMALVNGRTKDNLFFERSFERRAICIARVGRKYRKKILSAINLSYKLKKLGHDLSVDVVGVLEDGHVLSELKDLCNYLSIQDRIFFHTDKKVTTDAVRWLPDFDFSIGTGRGAMEAMCLGVLTLAPVSNLDIPIFVDDNTFGSLFEKNFSERSVSTLSESEALTKISNLFTKSDFNKERFFYQNIFNEYFDILSAPKKYDEIYSKAQRQSFSGIVDVFCNFIYLKYIERQKLK